MNYQPVGRNLLKVHELGPEDVKLKEFCSSTSENRTIDKCYAIDLSAIRRLSEPVAICGKLNGIIEKSTISFNDLLYIPIFTLGISMLTKKVKDDILIGEDIEIDTFDDKFYSLHKESISKKEDSEIFDCINAAVPKSHCIISEHDFSIHIFNQCIAMISEHGNTVKNILMHPNKYSEMLNWTENIFGKDTIKDVYETGNFPFIRDIKINVSDQVDKKSIYFLADPEIVGALPIARDKHIFAYFDKEERAMKYGVKEEIGIAIITEYGISKCSFSH